MAKQRKVIFLRVPDRLHELLVDFALERNATINDFAMQLLEKALDNLLDQPAANTVNMAKKTGGSGGAEGKRGG